MKKRSMWFQFPLYYIRFLFYFNFKCTCVVSVRHTHFSLTILGHVSCTFQLLIFMNLKIADKFTNIFLMILLEFIKWPLMYRKYIKILKNIFIFFNKQNIVKILYFLSCLKKNTKYALLKGKDFIDTGVFNIVRQNKYLI